MIELTQQQRQAVREGQAVRVEAAEVGAACVVVRADVYERLHTLLDDGPDARAVAQLIEHNMRDDDANDPLLASYQ